MPCNCGRTPAVQIRELKQKLAKENNEKNNKKNIVQSVEKNISADIQKLSHTDTVKISSINISNDSLNINYGGTPSTPKYSGLLSTTAFNAAHGIDKDTFKSVGYFGLGFSSGTLGNASAVSKLQLNQLDLNKFTHINVAFIAVNEEGHLKYINSGPRGGVNNNLPEWLTKVPKGSTDQEYIHNIFKELDNQRANSNNKHVKIIPSIGGWNIANDPIYGPYLNKLAESSKNYTSTTTTCDSKSFDNCQYKAPIIQTCDGCFFKNFISDIQDLVNAGFIDGVDIDWEYPGRDPMVSQCTYGSDSIPKACPISGGTKIVCDYTEDSSTCIGFETKSIEAESDKADKCNFNWNEPQSTPNPPESVYNKNLVTNYKNFMIKLKNELNKLSDSNNLKDDPLELSIALAGAQWGFHWYTETVVNLLKTELDSNNNPIIDYANLMAYDYTGYWQKGFLSGLLANYSNMDSLSDCSYKGKNLIKGCISKECSDCFNSGCLEKGKTCASWDNIHYECLDKNPKLTNYCTGDKDSPVCPDNSDVTPAKYTNGCNGTKGIVFTNDSNNLTPESSDIGCPLVYWNNLQTGGGANVSEDKQTLFAKQWWNDNGIFSNDSLIDPKNGKKNTQGRFTLSTETMINLLTNSDIGYGIDPKKLVVGLPYYGRSFQSDSDTNGLIKDGTQGLWSPYTYGAPYSYTDIHHKNLSTSNKNQYKIEMNDKGYKEQIYRATTNSDIITPITSKMVSEVVSYGSVDSINYIVNDIANTNNKNLGGYMCWHILSDYFEDVPSS